MSTEPKFLLLDAGFGIRSFGCHPSHHSSAGSCSPRIAKRICFADDLRIVHVYRERWRSCRLSGSRKVCMACHWFCDHSGVNCLPALIGQVSHGLIAHGEHLSNRDQGLTDDMNGQRGWAPQVA
jgi:hypothetical protein